MSYTIGEMAKLLNIPTSTLRYYDQEGLLPFIKRSESGIRFFQESDYEWLKIIECLKNTKMSLKDIRSYVLMAQEGDSTILARLNLLLKQRELVIAQMNDLQQTLDTLDYKIWYYETAKNAGSTSAPENTPTEDLPEKLQCVRKRLQGH